FQLHLFEFARAKSEIARIDFVAKRLADLCDSERQFFSRNVEDILELNENRLRGLRTQISHVRFLFSRADVGSEHPIEPPRLRQILPAANWTLLRTFFLYDLI